MQRTLVFTATYNEKENVAELIRRLFAVSREFDVLVVDDDSPDGTGALLDRMAGENPAIRVVRRPAKLGLGSAHHLAMLFVVKHGYERLVTMDADLSHEPEEIPRLLAALEDADFVIGSRYMPGGTSDYTGYRRLVSAAANSAARLLLGIRLHEFTTSFRAFRVASLARVNFEKMHNLGYSFFMETVFRLSQAGLRVCEVPITFRDRFAGTSKIPRLEILRGMIKLLHLTASRAAGRRMPAPEPHPLDHCTSCGSSYVSNRFPGSRAPAPETERSHAFQCTSFSHARKPRVIKCLHCGLSQVPSSEVDADLNAHYAHVVDQEYLDNLPAKRRTFERAYKHISTVLPPPGRMLEIGSYCGLFAEQARRAGWAVQGVEPSSWAAEYSRKSVGLDVFIGTLEQARERLRRDFDAVVSWDVIEHVPDPKRFLADAHSLLRPHGILAFSTIEIDSVFARLLGRRWPWIMEMHLYYFGNNVLDHMLRSTGFELLKVEPYRHYASLQYICRKLYSSFVDRSGKPPPGMRFVPRLVFPISMGDVRLYVARKVY